jgi:hypothetical protein
MSDHGEHGKKPRCRRSSSPEFKAEIFSSASRVTGSSPAVQPDHRDDLTEAPARDSTTIGEVSDVDRATVTYLAWLTSGSAAREDLHSRLAEPPTYRTESVASRPLRHGNLATLVMLLPNVAVLPVQVITIRPINTVRASRNPRRMRTLGSLHLGVSCPMRRAQLRG